MPYCYVTDADDGSRKELTQDVIVTISSHQALAGTQQLTRPVGETCESGMRFLTLT
jgi:hypothetical protein